MEKMDAPINIITRYVYNDLTFYNAQDNLYALYQINKNIYSFHISAAIDHFYKVEQNEAVNSAQKYLSITRFDPIFTRMWNDDDKSLDYINSFASQKGPSVACDVWRKRVRHESIDDDTLPEHITGPINTEFLFREKKYEDSFNYSRKLYLSALDCVPIRQTAVARMVECLFCQNKIQDAINLYVKYYIEDLPSVVKVDTLSIIHQLQDTLYENIRRNLNLVIFVALTCKEAVDISFILLEFCELKGVQKPSELFNVLSPDLEGVKNLELLYSLLNDDEILKNYSIIDSFEDRLIERKKLLQYIISLNTPRKDTYIELLKKVDDALLVYNFSHNLDESKIYANEEAIINYKLNEIDGKYSRFRLLVDTFIEQKKDILVVNLSQSIFDDQNYEQESKANLAIRTNGLYEIFNSLYQDIKEQFLYSDYGLVAYLSTRVRHGELESMLRPEVAQRHLILSTRDNVYQEDSYWTTTYNLGVREQSLLYNALQQFSTGFDYAVTSLIKKKLQIYDDKDRPEGLFNYEAEDKELALKAMEAGLSLKKMDDSKVAFFKFMFSWLWEKTEKSLIVIRNYVDQDFRSSIFQLIADLETTIKENMPTGHAQTDMLSEIRSASESLDAKIQKVSKWFNISHPKFDNVDFGTVSNKIYETVKSSHTDCVTNDILNIQGESFMIHADYVMHYVDILRNILSNMFAHGADSKDNKRHFKLDIVIGEENVILNFENYINCNPDDLNKIFAEKLKAKGLAFSEGGSGIAKVNKILKEDLKSNDNQIHMNAEGMICSTQVIIMLQNFKAYE